MRRLLPIALAGCLLAACSSPPPISSNPVVTATNQVNAIVPLAGANNLVVTGLQNAAFNLDNAMAIGALPGTDPASACVHGVLKQLGADVTVTPTGVTPVALPSGGTATSFTPKVSDLISGGSVAYILFQQAKQVQAGGIAVPTGCAAIVGQIVIDGAKTGINAGVGVLTGGLTAPLLQ